MLDMEAPWYSYFKKVYNLFKDDTELTIDSELVDNEDDTYEFTISSKNNDKLHAIEKLLGYGRVFGNIRVIINYGYENEQEEDWVEVYKKAFEGNPFFKEIKTVDMPYYGNTSYAIFKRDIISFYDDNLSDYHGNSHYIVADIVNDVVANPGIFACTSYE